MWGPQPLRKINDGAEGKEANFYDNPEFLRFRTEHCCFINEEFSAERREARRFFWQRNEREDGSRPQQWIPLGLLANGFYCLLDVGLVDRRDKDCDIFLMWTTFSGMERSFQYINGQRDRLEGTDYYLFAKEEFPQGLLRLEEDLIREEEGTRSEDVSIPQG